MKPAELWTHLYWDRDRNIYNSEHTFTAIETETFTFYIVIKQDETSSSQKQIYLQIVQEQVPPAVINYYDDAIVAWKRC